LPGQGKEDKNDCPRYAPEGADDNRGRGDADIRRPEVAKEMELVHEEEGDEAGDGIHDEDRELSEEVDDGDGNSNGEDDDEDYGYHPITR